MRNYRDAEASLARGWADVGAASLQEALRAESDQFVAFLPHRATLRDATRESVKQMYGRTGRVKDI